MRRPCALCLRAAQDGKIPAPLPGDNNTPEFASHCTLRGMADVAAARRVPLVDASALLTEQARVVETERERSLGLTPPPRGDERLGAVTVVFRVDMSGEAKGSKPYGM